ncbi:uncharacterized protein [Phyllobates terribilis]|uniref:uncharacterized protein isoform X2 n=1 Tax=Phyllobates terribilis TaxID=111132 RepID=UPI003CCA800A
MEVINLSTHVLSPAQIQVLEKGLTFSPTNTFDLFSVVKDLNLFARKLVLHKVHNRGMDSNNLEDRTPNQIEDDALMSLERLSEEQTEVGPSKFPKNIMPRSAAFPPLSACPAVEIFVNLVTNDFQKITTRKRLDNLSRAERQALDDLKSYDDIVIKPADKGGNVVLWPKEKYEREAYKQLKDRDTYLKVQNNPLPSFSAELEMILYEAFSQGIIPKKVYEGLLVKFPKIPTIYFIPKVHKNPLEPPGRPIVSGLEGLCQPICIFIDYYLKPLAQTLPSYVRDSTEVLTRINNITLETDMILVTSDVEALYTCIDHGQGIEAVRFFLGMSNWDGRTCELVVELLEYILTHNFFVFKDQFYVQKRGTAMGAACAPSYANLFMGYWERTIFGDEDAQMMSSVPMWLRYIDDILFIWQGDGDVLRQFMTSLNMNEFNIKLTYKCSREKIEFLDILIEVDEKLQIQTDVYRKETAVNSLLHAGSGHQYSTVKAIPVGQFLRIKRICSTKEGFERQAEDLRVRFSERGYSKRTIKHGYNRAKGVSRDALLRPTQVGAGRGGTIRFISTYNSEWQTMRSVLEKHWPVLQTEPSFSGVLSKNPQMTSRRSKNLRDILVKSHYTPAKCSLFNLGPPSNGCYPCGACVACCNIVRTKTFSTSDGSREFFIRQRITCNTSQVIYYATCNCNKIYIGLTTRQLKIRTREHVLDIIASKTQDNIEELKTIPRHFKLEHGSNPKSLKVRGIEHVQFGIRGGDIRKILAQRECKWIYVLGTRAPMGLNEAFSFSPFL